MGAETVWTSAETNGRSQRPARSSQDSFGAPTDTTQGLGGEEGFAGTSRLDRRSDRLEPLQKILPDGLGADWVGRHQNQARAA